MKLETIRFLQKLLTSDHLTLKGNQITSVAIVMQELQADEALLMAKTPDAPPAAPAAPEPKNKGPRVVRPKGK